MIARSNLHTHSIWCDGHNTLSEMAEAAERMGFRSLGFSSHARCRYTPGFGLTEETMPEYLSEIRRLQEQYAGRMELFCGMENDLGDPMETEGLDYVIGANHYARAGEDYFVVDDSRAYLENVIDTRFQGDAMDMVRSYYRLIMEHLETGGFDILAHIDLVTKFNEGNALFDEGSREYLDMAFEAVDLAAEKGVIVEVNTGAISRGFRTAPYPAKPILERMKAQNVPVILSSDAHRAEWIATYFDEAEALLRETGYRSAMELTRDGFVEIPL